MAVQNITTRIQIDAQDLDRLNARFDGLINRQEQLTSQLSSVSAQMGRTGSAGAAMGNTIQTGANNATTGLRNTQRESSILGNSFKSLGGILTGVFAVERILSFGKEIVQLGAKFDTLRTAIEFSSGSAEAGAVNLGYLADISKRLGLDLMGATIGFQTLLASTKSAGLSSKETRDIFEGVSTAARVMGRSTEDQKGIFLALSQMFSKGTVSAEELRGQLSERLPGAYEKFAQAVGMSTEQLGKALEDGLIKASDAIPKFAKLLKEEYEKGLPKAIESTGYQLNQLGSNYDKTLKNISESNAGFINTVIKQSAGFMDYLAHLTEDGDAKIIQRRLAGTGRFKEAITAEFKAAADAAKEGGESMSVAVEGAAGEYITRLKAQIKFFEKEFEPLKNGWNPFNKGQRDLGVWTDVQYTNEVKKRKDQLERMRAELKAVGEVRSTVLADASNETGKTVTPLGTIEEIEKAIKLLQQSKKDTVGLTQVQANQYNQTIKFYQDLLDKLNGVEKKAKKEKKLPAIKAPKFDLPKEAEEPWDILFKHYDDLEKKATETPQKMAEYWAHLWGGVMPEEMAKFTDAELEQMKKDQEEWEAIQDAKLEYRKAVEEEAVNFAISSANAYMDFRAQQLSDEMGMISAMREADLVLAGDNEQAKADINAEFARKEAEIKHKQAVNDRNQALFNIAVNTAQGVMSVLSTGGGTRYADFGVSAGLLSALVIATGAVQAGLVLARPIPQFFKGTDSSPEGYAWVGERGAEGKITPDGKFSMIPGGAHIDYLERGTKIIPNHKLSDFVGKEVSTPSMSLSDTHSSGIDIKGLGMEIGRNITLQQQTFDERGFRVYTIKQNQRKERLERKNRFNRS